ncbi:MAG: hypothetical protein AAFX78_00850 [Cyanobacteria bacterium J06638_20]
MAISQSEYTFLSILAQLSLFPENPTILEFGEQHWHGDVSLDDVKQDVDIFLPEQAQKVRQELGQLMQRQDERKNFDMAKIVYRLFFNYQNLTAIDLHGTENSLPLDLNHEISLGQEFDISINFGTGEHVFNVCQFFKTIHDCTKSGGIMLHVMPFLGWMDHGFFNFQPTIYWDLAESNHYEVLAFLFINGKQFFHLADRQAVTQYLMALRLEPQKCSVIPSNIYVAMRKTEEPTDFQIPMQKFFQMTPEEYWSMSKDF